MKRFTLNNLDDVRIIKVVDADSAELMGYTLINGSTPEFGHTHAHEKIGWRIDSFTGSDDGRSMGLDTLKKNMEALIKKHGCIYGCITEVGQFQVYIGLYVRKGPKKTKRIANNTLRVDMGTKEAIRLHDTNILVFESDHVTLDSGGFRTKTTKKRMNDYLPKGVYIRQKNFEWYVEDSRDNSVKVFEDGMTIAN